MAVTNIDMKISVVGSDDGKETFEVSRIWDSDKKKALVFELYPTITAEQALCVDKSTAALINHADYFGWGMVTICNLYSDVFTSKPLVANLRESPENFQHIEESLDASEKGGYDEIVIAWGSSLATHTGTNVIKQYILNLLLERGLLEKTKHIVTELLMTNDGIGTHPLYLSLRHNSEEWYLYPYPLEDELERLNMLASETEENQDKENSKENKANRRRAKKQCAITES